MVLGGAFKGGDLEGSVTTDGWDPRQGDFGQFSGSPTLPDFDDLSQMEEDLSSDDEFKFNRFKKTKSVNSNGSDENNYEYDWTFNTTPGEVGETSVTGGNIDVSGDATNTRTHFHTSNTTVDDHESSDLERSVFFNEDSQEEVVRTIIEHFTKENEGSTTTTASSQSEENVVDVEGIPHLERSITNGTGPAFSSSLDSSTTLNQKTRDTKINGDDPDDPNALQGYRVINTSTYTPNGAATTTNSVSNVKSIEQALVKRIPMSTGVLDLLHSTGLGGDLTFGGGEENESGDNSGTGSGDDNPGQARVFQNAAGQLLGFESTQLEEGEYISGKIKLTQTNTAVEKTKVISTLNVDIVMDEPTRLLDLNSTTDTTEREASVGTQSEVTFTYGSNGSIVSRTMGTGNFRSDAFQKQVR